jgi:hypothetical protein
MGSHERLGWRGGDIGKLWRTLLRGHGQGRCRDVGREPGSRGERMSGGGGGSAGFGNTSRTGGSAGKWVAVFIIVLSAVMIINNFNLISHHIHLLGMDGTAFETVPLVRPDSMRGGSDSEMAAMGGGSEFAMGGLDATSSEDEVVVQEEESVSQIRVPILSPHPCEGFSIPPPPADPKRTGPRPCPVCYLPEDMARSQMPVEQRYVSPVLKRLTYVVASNGGGGGGGGGEGEGDDHGDGDRPPGSQFGGYPTLEERAASFNVTKSMRVHCGFVKGPTVGAGTGFDIDEDDREAMNACRGVVVASAIFGNYDELQQPKNISKAAEESVCFFMFVDEETETSLDEYEGFQSTKRVGLWRVVVVRNLPYTDARRTGKIPKLLLHRLFPNVRFSIWVDGKLELVQDPYKILERFLWRTNDTFAISQHYKRFDVFLEADANKAAAKYDNKSIDAQVGFYRAEGMTPYSAAKLPITSDVPEGCVIIREHTPIANLMSCLWFNEVDRFTSRDQLSFGIVRNKLTASVPWRINMFLDCERRNFVVQGYHRDVLEKKGILQKPKMEEETAATTAVMEVEAKSVVVVDNARDSKPDAVVVTHSTPKRKRTSSRHRKEVQGRRLG